MPYDINIINGSFPPQKPIIVAANGPAVGGVVTSATLCDAIIASDTATFSTPFSALGLVPEGCSSVHFERIMRGGRADAERMLGPEGWKPTAKEAKEAGLVSEVVPYDQVQTLRAHLVYTCRTGNFENLAELPCLILLRCRNIEPVLIQYLLPPSRCESVVSSWAKSG